MSLRRKTTLGFTLVIVLAVIVFIPPWVRATSTCVGDLNGDGKTDAADYVLLRGAFFSNDPAKDLNHDGVVDISDYVILVQNYLVPCATQMPNVTPPPGGLYQGNRSVLNDLFIQGSWNTLAKNIPVDDSRKQWVSYLYEHGPSARPGNFNLGWREYTYPVFIADANTPRYPVSSANPDWGTIDGQTMPYDPSWQASIGADAQIIVLDPQNEKYYDLWQVQGLVSGKVRVSNGSVISNFRSKNGINLPSRGAGIAYFAMLVTPEEVEAGVIRHALSMTTQNTGPQFVAPAVKSDGGQFGVANGIPEGTRFALTMTDAQIDSYVKSKPANLQKLARALVVALRDYGWIITDSSGGATVQIEDYHTAGPAWTRILGIPDIQNDNDALRDLLDGIDWLNAVVLTPRT